MKKIVLIFTVIIITIVANSCGKSIDARQNLINASNLYLEDKKLDKELADKAAEVAVESGKYCVTPKPEIPCPTCTTQEKIITPRFDQVEDLNIQSEASIQPQVIILQTPTQQIIKEKVVYKNLSRKRYTNKKEIVYVQAEDSYNEPQKPSNIITKKDCGCSFSLPCFNASAKQKGLKWSSSDPATAKVLNSDGTYYTGTENPFEGGYEKQK